MLRWVGILTLREVHRKKQVERLNEEMPTTQAGSQERMSRTAVSNGDRSE